MVHQLNKKDIKELMRLRNILIDEADSSFLEDADRKMASAQVDALNKVLEGKTKGLKAEKTPKEKEMENEEY